MVRAPRDGHARSTATLDGAESPGPGSVSRQLDGPSITAESISVRSIGALAGHGAGAFQAWGSAPLRRLSGLWTWPCHPISAGPILPSVPNRMAFQPLIKTPAMGRGLSTSVGRELDGWVAAGTDTGFLGCSDVGNDSRGLSGHRKLPSCGANAAEMDHRFPGVVWTACALWRTSARCPGHPGKQRLSTTVEGVVEKLVNLVKETRCQTAWSWTWTTCGPGHSPTYKAL